MKLSWKKDNKGKKRPLGAISKYPNLPFDLEGQGEGEKEEATEPQKALEKKDTEELSDTEASRRLAESFQSQGNKLAEDGQYREALGKWEAALNMMPENAVLHEQKAQVLLEVGDTWSALKAATRATELDQHWAEAWITLGRTQLNFGEPACAIESFDKALAIKPDSKEARDDRHTASNLVKRRKQLHCSGLNANENRFSVGDNTKGC